MTDVLVVAPPPPDAPTLVADLESVGMRVVGRCVCAELVRAAVQHAPKLIVVWEPYPGVVPEAPLYAAVRLLHAVMPCPVLVFTSEVAAEAMSHSLACGISSWVVNGYARERLRPLIQYTQARAAHAAALRAELEDLRLRYEERRLVDRAKGILMSSRQVNEDEAFRLLRSASMQTKQRIGQLSQQVIDASQYAESINRAGRLRMLSQRMVKLYALTLAGVEVGSSRALLADSVAQTRQSLEYLAKQVSRPSFGDLLDAALQAWAPMERLLVIAATPDGLQPLDAQAEVFLQAAERLAGALEGAGLATSLHVINVSGRQRMHAQRLAKQALLAGSIEDLLQTTRDFEAGLQYLQGIPLSSPTIREQLGNAEQAWQRLREAVSQGPSAATSVALAASSEELLQVFDQLTVDYERSMQLLIG